MGQNFKIILAQESHIQSMVQLSWKKRRNYEQVQPRFWMQAEHANQIRVDWFDEILAKESYLAYVAA